MSTASPMSLVDLENDPRLFLYTSLTAGSSHIITATSRLETILKANKIPFQAIDMATDEKARRLWQRRCGGRKIPGLVKEGFVIGDLNEIEEWNEFGELKQNIGPVPAANAPIPKGGQVGVQIAPPSIVTPTASGSAAGTTVAAAAKPATTTTAANVQREEAATAVASGFDKSKGVALPGAEEIKARSEAKKAEVLSAPKPESMTTAADVKEESLEAAKEAAEEEKIKEAKPDEVDQTIESGDAKAETVAEVAAEEQKGPEVEAKDPSEEKTPKIEEEKHGDEVEIAQSAEKTEADGNVQEITSEDTKVDAAENKEAEVKEKVDDEEQGGAGEEADLSGGAATHAKAAPEEASQLDHTEDAVTTTDAADEASSSAGIATLKIDDEAKESEVTTQQQSAKEPDDAGKSVQD